MARKEAWVTIDGENRDSGKVFHLQEMPASQAEWWALRAFLALGKNGVEVPDGVANMGMAALAVEGLKALTRIPPAEAWPLLEEMMSCVQAVPNPADKSVLRPLTENDIEEIATRLRLRSEVFKLHVDFFTNAASPISPSDSAVPSTSAV